MKVSSVELTALDLLRYPQASAGLDNIVTILADLGEKIDSEKLASVSLSFPKSIVQRLGHLLDQLGHADATQPMLRELLREQLLPGLNSIQKKLPSLNLRQNALREINDGT